MKKLRYPIAMLSLFAAFLAVTGCQKEKIDPSLEDQIIGKWTMHAAIADHTDYGINYQDTTWFSNDDYFDFKADGTVSIMARGVSYQGDWKMKADSVSFNNTGYVDFPGGFRVLSLTASDLKLSHIQNNPPNHFLDAKLNFKR